MAYGFYCHSGIYESYTIGWTVDHHYRSSRLRFPRGHRRITDEAGARKFCKKHDLVFVRDGKATYA